MIWPTSRKLVSNRPGLSVPRISEEPPLSKEQIRNIERVGLGLSIAGAVIRLGAEVAKIFSQR